MRYTIMNSQLGPVMLAESDEGLHHISFQEGEGTLRPLSDWEEVPDLKCDARRQLQQYFEGARTEFDLPLAPEGTTFQRQVWEALLKIKFGRTATYGEIAETINKPKASRAVGSANGKNPLPIVIPCHRIIGSSGKLTGYAGGLKFNKALLELEGIHS